MTKQSFISTYSKRHTPKLFRSLTAKVSMLIRGVQDFEGRSVTSSSMQVDDPSTRFSNLFCADFALENQLEQGVAEKDIITYSPTLSEIDYQIQKTLDNEAK